MTIGSSYEVDYQGGGYFAIPQSMQPGWPGEMAVEGKASLGIFLSDPIIRTTDVGGSMLAIVEGSQNPARAMQFIDLLESDEYLINLIVFGIEGVHYEFADRDAGIVEVTAQGEEQYNMRGNAWMFGNQLMNYLTTEEDPAKWDIMEKFNDEGVVMLSLGFYYKVPANLQPIQAAVRDVRREYNALFTGQLNVEEKLPEFLAALEAAGAQQLIDDVQAQFDAWYADNNPS
jgi:putative aldouronate transport system substrate-binding protein